MAKFTHKDTSLKSKYWDKFSGDKMSSQAVANAMLDRCIVSKDIFDVSGAAQFALNTYCKAGLVVDGDFGKNSLEALLKYTGAPNPNFFTNEKNIVAYVQNYTIGSLRKFIEAQKKAPAKAATTTITATPAKTTTTTTATPAKIITPVVPAITAATPNNFGKIALYIGLAAAAGVLLFSAQKKKKTAVPINGLSKKKTKKKTKINYGKF